ncbi:hypothetical protein HKD37_16G045381 [Glycine soja]
MTTSMWPPLKHWNGKQRGPKRKNGAETSSEGCCGAATASSSFEGPRETSRESEDKLKACQRSKRSLSEQLSRTEENMWAIIDQYKEKLSLTATHEQRLEDEYVKVSVLQAKREARERVIDSLHIDAMMWMDRFAFTLNGSQELPRLLAKAKAMADVYLAPEEEQMKADMEALKDQMTSMIEAMLSMKRIIESNMAATATEADPTHPSAINQANQPIPDVLGQGGEVLGSTGGPHVGHNNNAYPYGLPPNYTPPTMHMPNENANHVVLVTFEGQQPQPIGGVREEPQEHAQGDFDPYPTFTTEGPTFNVMPRPNTAGAPQPRPLQSLHFSLVGYMPSSFADLVFAGERIEVGQKRGKFNYVAPACMSNRRFRASGAMKKEGEAHISNARPTKGTHSTTKGPHSKLGSYTTSPRQQLQSEHKRQSGMEFPGKKLVEFALIPMSYANLLPSLIANQMLVVTPERIFQSPFPRWYNANETYAYHRGVPGHSIEQCVAFKHKVQSLIDADGPNVKTNPLASHGGPSVNVVEEYRPQRPKQMKDVVTSSRFILKVLREAVLVGEYD